MSDITGLLHFLRSSSEVHDHFSAGCYYTATIIDATLFYGMLLAEQGDVIWCNTSLLSPLGHMPSSNSLPVRNQHSVPLFSLLGLMNAEDFLKF